MGRLRTGLGNPITGFTMVTREDIEAFLDRLSADGANYKEIEPGLWKVRPSGKLEVDFIVHHNPPVVVIRVKVMDLPDSNGSSPGLYRRLLELNATDLVHGSYGISDRSIVLTEALELAHLDYEEFQSSYEAMSLALATHLRELTTFSEVR